MAAATMPLASPLSPSPRCSIYALDSWLKPASALPDRYIPARWTDNQFSAELWLHRALQTHPWRVGTPEKADLVFIAANFSRLCFVGKIFSARREWAALVKSDLRPNFAAHQSTAGAAMPLHFNLSTPAAVVLTNTECTPPWTGGGKVGGLFRISDRGRSGVVAPFVVPEHKLSVWQAAATRRPWAERPLLFFAMHVPKLYISGTRYAIWRQIRHRPDVLAVSSTINCTIGQYAHCDVLHNKSYALEKPFYSTYCRPYCEAKMWKDMHATALPSKRNSSRIHWGKCAASRASFRSNCRPYMRIDWVTELPHIFRASRLLQPREYGEAIMGHRFCIVAPGDFVSSPKIAEFSAAGALGGCIPLIIVRERGEESLPYTRWLDWCDIAVLVPEAVAVERMDSVLDALARMTPEEAAVKQRALRRVLDAFVWRAPADAGEGTAAPVGGSRRSATDFLLAEACAAAEGMRAGGGVPVKRARVCWER